MNEDLFNKVEAEFEASLDKYMEGWEAALRSKLAGKRGLPQAPQVKALKKPSRRGQPCEQGQTTEKTGCVPDQGAPSQAPTEGSPQQSENPQIQAAVDWVNSQESWKGKVNVRPGKVDVREVAPNPGVTLTKQTVGKWERRILKELEEFGRPQRPLVVSKREDGKWFLHDGNHYYRAMVNLAKAGKLKLEEDKTLPAVEVVPKPGYHFRTYVDDRHYIMTEELVKDEKPTPPQVKQLDYPSKGKGEPCKPGEASTQTGCTPAEGPAKAGAQPQQAKPQQADYQGEKPADKVFDPKAVQWLMQQGLIGGSSAMLTAERANELLNQLREKVGQPRQDAPKQQWGDPDDDKAEVLKALDLQGLTAQEALDDKMLRQEVMEALADTSKKGPINKSYLYSLLHTLSRETRVINLDDYPTQQRHQPNYEIPGGWPKDLTPQEMTAINLYTRHEFYAPLNQALRETGEPTQLAAPIHEALQSAMAKVKQFDVPVQTYRGIEVPPDEVPKLLEVCAESLEGQLPLRMGGYLSTSVGATIAQDRNVRLWINAVHGLDVQPVSDHPGENELLLNHNSQFQVTKIKQDKLGNWVIHMDQLPPEQHSQEALVQEGLKWLNARRKS